MNDAAFLVWIHARLVDEGENPNVDYMRKLLAIAAATPEDQRTIVTLGTTK